MQVLTYRQAVGPIHRAQGTFVHAGAAGRRYAAFIAQTLTLDDLDDGDESVLIVRTVPGGVGLTLSKKASGDLEVFMPPAVAERVALALREAAG